MVSLEDYAKDNPHKSRFSQMEDPKLEKLVDEAIAGIKKGIEPTIAAKWVRENSPIEITIQHDTVRQWLYDKARERI